MKGNGISFELVLVGDYSNFIERKIFPQVFAVLPYRPVASLSLGAQYASMAQRSRRQIYETAFDSKVRSSRCINEGTFLRT